MIKFIRLLTPLRLFKLICICLSREENTSFLQQVNFTGKLEDDAANMIFLLKYSKEPFQTFL